MPVYSAKLINGVPCCPLCGGSYGGEFDDYGVEREVGYYFRFTCKKCSTKRKKVFVVTVTDGNFRPVNGRSD